MINGYPSSSSVRPGECLSLHVSTSSSEFVARFHRYPNESDPILTVKLRSKGWAVPASSGADWKWPSYSVEIPEEWGPGVYLVHLRELDCSAEDWGPSDPPGLLFVVRKDAAVSPTIFKLPLATYHAYNFSGGGSLYRTPAFCEQRLGRAVSLRRPGGGIGGIVPCCEDVYKPDTTRQTFRHWDGPFIAWLLENGYNLDFCTSLDLDDCRGLLVDYSLLIIGAHDEYWSERERAAVEEFIAEGGNVAIFGGNTCWWRIHYSEDHSLFSCHKGDFGDSIADQHWSPDGDATPPQDRWWSSPDGLRPEDCLTGVSYRNGGGWWEGHREPLGYVVQCNDHWVFEGTGLGLGDRFGHNCVPPLVGYECDGLPLENISEGGIVTLHRDAAARGTPARLTILGAARLSGHWQELPAREGEGEGQGLHAASMVIYERNGMVFNAGTTDWVSVLTRNGCHAVATVTHNILRRLQNRAAHG